MHHLPEKFNVPYSSSIISLERESDSTCWTRITIKIKKADHICLATDQSYLNQDCPTELFHQPFMIWILVYESNLNMVHVKSHETLLFHNK